MKRVAGALCLTASLTAGCASREGNLTLAVPTAGIPSIAATALALLGTPYRDGGSGPEGFDCSGFTSYVFAQHGVTLPRQVAAQFAEGVPVRRQDIQPGDLVFFETVAPGASHVGVALGDDRFIHAPSSRGAVRVERLISGYWAERFVGTRRITGGKGEQEVGGRR